jgi:hypothetical protein
MRLVETDINTAIRMLEAAPEAWRHVGNPEARSALCNLYLDVCTSTAAPEMRSQALLNLGSLLGELLSNGDTSNLPSAAQLDGLWRQLQKGAIISPSLSCAIVETSGTIMAALLSQPSQEIPDMAPRLQHWGKLLSECLDVNNVSHLPPETKTLPQSPGWGDQSPVTDINHTVLRHTLRGGIGPQSLLHPH